jgi:hypothetical protein
MAGRDRAATAGGKCGQKMGQTMTNDRFQATVAAELQWDPKRPRAWLIQSLVPPRDLHPAASLAGIQELMVLGPRLPLGLGLRPAGTALGQPRRLKDVDFSVKPHVPGLTRQAGLAARTHGRECPIWNDVARAMLWRWLEMLSCCSLMALHWGQPCTCDATLASSAAGCPWRGWRCPRRWRAGSLCVLTPLPCR